MSKSFFVVIPYGQPVKLNRRGLRSFLPGAKPATDSSAEATTEFQESRLQLEQRAAVVEQGFGRIGLRVVALGTEELVELYFKIFNPGESDLPTVNQFR